MTSKTYSFLAKFLCLRYPTALGYVLDVPLERSFVRTGIVTTISHGRLKRF